MNRTSAVAIILLALSSMTAAAQTRIASASTSAVRVQAGGAAVRLTVQGSDLNAITSARLLLPDGRAVKGFAVTFTPVRVSRAGSSSQLVFDLEADAAVPAGDYKLEITTARQRMLVPASITVEPPPGPEVSAATPTTLVLGPRESGSIQLSGSNLDKLTSAHVVDGNGRLVYHVRAQLQPGGTTQRTVLFTVPDNPNQRGPFGTPMTLMATGQSGSATATPARVEVRPTYDLYISRCEIQPLSSYGWFKGRVTITNHGINTIAASLPDRATLVEYDSHPDKPGTTHIVGPGGGLYLPRGQSWTYEIGSITFSPDPEPNTLLIKLFPRDDERSHANNERTCGVPPHPAEPKPTLHPDLIVSQIAVTPASGPPSTEFTVTVTVKNQGDGALTLSGSTPAWVRCTIPDETAYLTSLAPGATRQFTFRITHSLPPGQKQTTCTVDAAPSKVTESNENNNSRSASFVVTSYDSGTNLLDPLVRASGPWV